MFPPQLRNTNYNFTITKISSIFHKLISFLPPLFLPHFSINIILNIAKVHFLLLNPVSPNLSHPSISLSPSCMQQTTQRLRWKNQIPPTITPITLTHTVTGHKNDAAPSPSPSSSAPISQISLPFTPPSPPTASSHSQTSAETAGPSHTSTSAATLPGPTSYRIPCIPRIPPSIRTSILHLRGSDPPRAANRSSSPPAEPLSPAGIGNTIA